MMWLRKRRNRARMQQGRPALVPQPQLSVENT
jgi:hypothetical protein